MTVLRSGPADAGTSGPEPESPQPKRPRRRWVRWIRRLTVTGLLLGLLLGGLGAWVILSASGTRTALRVALDWYDTAIPGRAEVTTIEGSLGGTLVLGGIELTDGQGGNLVTAERLELTADWDALLGGVVGVTHLRIDGAVVTANGSWTALAPVSEPQAEPKPQKEEPGLGPRMPRIEVGQLEIHDATVQLLRSGVPTTLAEVERLDVTAAGDGHDADAQLDLVAVLPNYDVDVESLSLEAGWHDPVASAPQLTATGNFGTIALSGARFDADTFEHGLQRLSVQTRRGWINDQFASLPAGLAMTLEGTSGDGAITLDVGATTDQGLGLALAVETAIPRDGLATARGDVHCIDCGVPGLAADATVDGHYDLDSRTGEVTLAIHSGATTADVRAHAGEDGTLDVQTEWTSTDLAGLNPILQAFDAPPLLAGKTRGATTCRIVVDPLDLRCQVEAGLEEFPPVAAANVRADIAAAPPKFDITLHELSAKLPPYAIAQVDGPARVTIDDGRIEVSDAALRQDRRGGVARIDGVYDAKASSHANVELQRFDLASLRPVLPTLGLRGSVTASIHGRYDGHRATADANISGHGVQVRGVPLGRVHLASEVSESRARAKLKVRSAKLGQVTTDIDVPYRLDSATGVPALGPGSISANVELSDVVLRRFRPFIPGWAATGEVDATLRMTGTAASPRIAAKGRASQLAWDSFPLGTVQAQAGYRRGRATARIELEHPWIDGDSTIDAQAPVSLDLRGGRARWHEHGPHQLHAEIGAIDLDSVGSVAEVPLSGRASFVVDLQGDLHDPTWTTRVSATDLTYDEIAIGDVELKTDTHENRTTAWMGLSSPLAGAVIVDATLPVELDLLAAKPRWRKSQPHRLDLQASGVHLSRVATLGPEFDARGSVDLRFTLDGTATEPELALGVTAHGMVVEGIPVDAFDLTGSYEDDTARVDALVHRANGTIHVLGMVPVHLDLGAPEAIWLDQSRHEVVAELRDFDLEAISPWLDVEDTEGVDITVDGDVRLGGSRDAFSLTTTANAEIHAPGLPSHQIALRATGDSTRQEGTLILRDGTKVRGRARAELGLNVGALLDGSQPTSEVPVDVVVGLRDVSLARLAGLFPAELNQPVGTIRSDIAVHGTLGAPRLEGDLTLAKAGVTIVPARQRFEDIGLRLDFSNDRIELSRLRLRSGPGTMDIKGHLDLADAHVRGKVFVEASKMPFRQPPLPTTRVTTQVATTLDFGPDRSTIDVKVDNTLLEVQSLSNSGAKPIPQNANVVYVDDDGSPIGRDTQAADAAPSKRTKPLDAKLAFVTPVVVRGPMVNMEWDGGFTASTTPDLAIEGDLNVTPVASTINLIGNEFVIQRGEVAFAEGADLIPFINMDADANVAGVKITASIRGRVTHPEIRMTSEPPYSEQEIFAILVTGTTDSVGSDDSNVTAQAASALAAFSAPALQESVGEALGVDRISMSFGESVDEPIVSVGKNLRKKVYGEASFHANAPVNTNRTELMLRYRFVPQWTYEVFYGDRSVGGMGVWWIRMFDTPLRGKRSGTDDSREKSQHGRP